jgi:hypothetical protein
MAELSRPHDPLSHLPQLLDVGHAAAAVFLHHDRHRDSIANFRKMHI